MEYITTAPFHILVVEDNLGDFILVEDFILREISEPVITHARTFEEAKALIENEDFQCQLVLLDLSLPDQTGEALIEEVVSLCHHIPIVVLTGYTNFNFGMKSLGMGISDYLLKDDLTASSLFKSIIYSTERKRIISELEMSEKRARGFAGQLNNALEEERSRMAREIHDEFGQQLSGLKMSLSALRKRHQGDRDMEELIVALVADVDHSIDSVRRLANELRPALLDKLGLFSAIEWLVVEFQKKTGVEAQFRTDFEQPMMEKSIEINIFRICQEALTNIAKHAKATRVGIQIERVNTQLLIKIMDNGKGIGSEILKDPLSMGLMNMKERSNLIQAELQINSAQAGTVIELIIDHIWP
ncbi:MAG: histidine kinase [Pedobacter sp.]|nr:histidine kinase [Pedobacter sp.]